MEALNYNLGEPKDAEGDDITIEWTISSKGSRFIQTDEETVFIWQDTGTPDFLGVYSVKVKLTDDSPAGPLSNEYEFWITLKEDPENPVDEWDDEEFEVPEEILTWDTEWDELYLFVDLREESQDFEREAERPVPHIVSLGYTGLLRIAFDKPMEVPDDPTVAEIHPKDVLILRDQDQRLLMTE